jgi:putative addiction module component (TIGR02574 family)
MAAILDAGTPAAYIHAMSVAAIRDEALSLPAHERAKLIDALWDSLSAKETQARESAWAAESERRIDAYDAGTLKARDAESVFAELREDLRK